MTASVSASLTCVTELWQLAAPLPLREERAQVAWKSNHRAAGFWSPQSNSCLSGRVLDFNLSKKNTANQMENAWFTALGSNSIRKVNQRLMGVTHFQAYL